jgi:proline racemase
MKIALFAFFASAALLSAATFTGTISDSMCRNDHKAMNVSPDAKCVRDCVHGGESYVLVDGKNTWKLSDQKTPEGYAAQRVRVTGTLDTKSGVITVTSIDPVR